MAPITFPRHFTMRQQGPDLMTYDPNKNTSELRQGDKHKTNFRVLVIALGALILAFIIIYIVYSMMPQGNVIQ